MSEDVPTRARRRHTAILVAGYSRVLPGDEKQNFAELRAFVTGVIRPQIAEFGGNIFKEAAELVLADFEDVARAARCATALRDRIAHSNQTLPEEDRMAIRVGINVGDIIIEDGDAFGDDVNIAARVGALAKPGSLYLSEAVHDQLAGEINLEFEDLGPQELKNISRPIRVYRVAGDMAELSEELVAAVVRSAASPPAFDDRRAIAVLPFVNFGGDPEQEFFADGVTEDIISMLAGWRAFPVIARNSTFIYKGKSIDVKKVGEELVARYVLEGSVRKSGGRVRVTAQLIRTDTGHHIMAERFDRDLTDLFELQDEITRIIVGALEPELLKFERNRIANRPQHNEDAYELYQRGMFHHYRHNKTDNVNAQEFFQRALTADPHYPQATAALAIAVLNAGFLNWADSAERNYEEASRLAERAVSLDARYPTAHWAFGAACMYTHRHDQAVAEMHRAIELNPSFSAAHATLGHLLAYAGRPEEAIPVIERAIRLNPADPRLFITLPALACAHYQLRNYKQAVEIGQRSWGLNRNWPTGLTYVVASLAQLGRMEEAAAALGHFKQLRRIDRASWEGHVRRLFKDPTAADHLVDGLRKAGFE